MTAITMIATGYTVTATAMRMWKTNVVIWRNRQIHDKFTVTLSAGNMVVAIVCNRHCQNPLTKIISVTYFSFVHVFGVCILCTAIIPHFSYESLLFLLDEEWTFSLRLFHFRAFFDKIKLEFADILEANKVDMNNVSLTFQRVLQFPLKRTLEYQKLLATVSDLYPAVSFKSNSKLLQPPPGRIVTGHVS